MSPCLHAFLLLVLALAHAPLARSQHRGVCALPYCECNPALHPSWTTVNCTVPIDKQLDIFEGDLPNTTTELVITGGEALLLNVNALSQLQDARSIRIDGTKLILIRKFTAVNMNVVSVYLEINNCDTLRVEEKSFTNLKGPLSVSVNNCEFVSLESESFSWLLSMKIENANKLQLSPGAFMLDPTAANVGEHGPGMSIELKNLAVSEFTSQTFGSSAAKILMQSVSVDHIYSDAFIANTYNTVIAINCSFNNIHGEAFAQKSLINNLLFLGCKIHLLSSNALQSAVANLNITGSTFENIETGAVNITVATVTITDSVFNNFDERGFQLSSCNKFKMERNSFDELAQNAIIAPGASIHELVFKDNEIEAINDNSLGFIGQAQLSLADGIEYKNNYFGAACHCEIVSWLGKVLGAASGETFMSDSFCTVSEFFAKCFHVPEQNMLVSRFVDGVCGAENSIKCLPYKTGIDGETTAIKNPRFPHIRKEKEGISERDKKIIGIVVVTAIGCVLIVMLISLIRWFRRKGYCTAIKNFLFANSSCSSFCERFCLCRTNRSGLDNAGSISQIAVHEYSERHRLNEPRVETIQETSLPGYTQEMVQTDDKTTQTLPEELTKELLESLKNKLDDPNNYTEAREMIEHLYELVKVEEVCNSNTPIFVGIENIYELPFQNTAPRLGRNKKRMVSIGTRTPSLDKLKPISPYNRQTALAHEYFEPKDFAIHLYAEIANCDRDRRAMKNAVPDVVAEQPMPRGPYLSAVRDKLHSSSSSSPSEWSSCSLLVNSPPLKRMSTIASNKSSNSNSSEKMMNRPLPAKPTTTFDPGEGTSNKHD